MKKYIALLLSLVLLLSCSSVLSEGFDLSSLDLTALSTQELLTLKDAISKELAERGEGAILYPGDYLVGEDLEAGSYLVSISEIGEGHKFNYLNLFETADDVRSMNILDCYPINIGEMTHVTLRDGMVLQVKYGSCLLTAE